MNLDLLRQTLVDYSKKFSLNPAHSPLISSTAYGASRKETLIQQLLRQLNDLHQSGNKSPSETHLILQIIKVILREPAGCDALFTLETVSFLCSHAFSCTEDEIRVEALKCVVNILHHKRDLTLAFQERWMKPLLESLSQLLLAQKAFDAVWVLAFLHLRLIFLILSHNRLGLSLDENEAWLEGNGLCNLIVQIAQLISSHFIRPFSAVHSCFSRNNTQSTLNIPSTTSPLFSPSPPLDASPATTIQSPPQIDHYPTNDVLSELFRVSLHLVVGGSVVVRLHMIPLVSLAFELLKGLAEVFSEVNLISTSDVLDFSSTNTPSCPLFDPPWLHIFDFLALYCGDCVYSAQNFQLQNNLSEDQSAFNRLLLSHVHLPSKTGAHAPNVGPSSSLVEIGAWWMLRFLWLIENNKRSSEDVNDATRLQDQFLSFLILIHHIVKSDDKSRKRLKTLLLPHNIRTNLIKHGILLEKGLNLGYSLVVRSLTSVLNSTLNLLIGELLFEVCDRDGILIFPLTSKAHRLIFYLGYGNAAGILQRKHLLQPPPPESPSVDDLGLHGGDGVFTGSVGCPITLDTSNSSTAPPFLSVEEEMAERERLMGLFEKLEKTGVISARFTE